MHYHKELRSKYENILDSLYNLLKFSRKRELELDVKLDLARDELQRILVCPGATDEIKDLCKRGLIDTK